MPNIKFDHENIIVKADHGEWLYDVVQRANIGIPFSCKAGACGTCATEVLEGNDNLGDQSAREVRALNSANLDPKIYRLPCLCDVHGDVVFGKPFLEREKGTKLSKHQVIVESYRPLNGTVAEIRFFIENPEFDFHPGQYMIFRIPHPGQAIHRSYSISTPPSDKSHFEICVRSVAGGHGSNYIHRLRTGNQLEVEGPFGDFVLQENSKKQILMIATGTGMAPIKSMLMHLLDKKSSRKVRLFFGNRHETDLFYTDLFRGLKANYPEFEYDMILSSPNPNKWSGYIGRVTDLIEQKISDKDSENTEVYLCGGRKMIEDCKQILEEKKFPDASIHFENFF